MHPHPNGLPQVPVRLRTQGAFSGAQGLSSPTRQASPPAGGIGLVGLLNKKGDYMSDDGERALHFKMQFS
jgi:hypothetical protein